MQDFGIKKPRFYPTDPNESLFTLSFKGSTVDKEIQKELARRFGSHHTPSSATRIALKLALDLTTPSFLTFWLRTVEVNLVLPESETVLPEAEKEPR